MPNTDGGHKLVVIETHPVQYHAPVYRAVQKLFSIPVTVIYGSDFSLAGFKDREFGTFFAWDTDLLSGYEPVFLSRVAEGGANTADATQAKGLARKLHQIEHSAVMLTGYSGAFYRSSLYCLWKRRTPLLFRAETTDHARMRSSLQSWIRDRALERLYERCAKVLYIGRHSYDHLTRLGCPIEKLVFSPYCVDISPFQCDEDARLRLRESTRKSLAIHENDVVLLFSGKLTPRKAPALILEAVRTVPEPLRSSLQVLFLGDGELREQINALSRTEPSVRAQVLGFRNQRGLSEFFHASDLLILPSLHSETWGLVVNEALRHGLPCVVSEGVGSAPDLVHNGVTGAICQPGSAESLAQAIVGLLPILKRPETRDACRNTVACYGVEQAARGIANAFQGVLSSELNPN